MTDRVRARAKAQQLVGRLCKHGLLERGPCEVCGIEPHIRKSRQWVLAHHDDYAEPAVVRWLCALCHSEWHAANEASYPEVDIDNAAYRQIFTDILLHSRGVLA